MRRLPIIGSLHLPLPLRPRAAIDPSRCSLLVVLSSSPRTASLVAPPIAPTPLSSNPLHRRLTMQASLVAIACNTFPSPHKYLIKNHIHVILLLETIRNLNASCQSYYGMCQPSVSGQVSHLDTCGCVSVLLLSCPNLADFGVHCSLFRAQSS